MEYYNNGKLKFEGKFLNGKKNGKGKEYYETGKLKFESEYKDNLLNGKVKEYNNKGKLTFDGEYKDGNKWKGRADEIEFDGFYLGYFNGEYLNGKRWNGKAREYKDICLFPDCVYYEIILAFEGEYINGKKKGKGEKYDLWNRIKYKVEYDLNDNPDEPIYIFWKFITKINYFFIYFLLNKLSRKSF